MKASLLPPWSPRFFHAFGGLTCPQEDKNCLARVKEERKTYTQVFNFQINLKINNRVGSLKNKASFFPESGFLREEPFENPQWWELQSAGLEVRPQTRGWKERGNRCRGEELRVAWEVGGPEGQLPGRRGCGQKGPWGQKQNPRCKSASLCQRRHFFPDTEVPAQPSSRQCVALWVSPTSGLVCAKNSSVCTVLPQRLQGLWWSSIKNDPQGSSVIIVQSLSHVQLFSTPWTATRQGSLSCTISQSLPRAQHGSNEQGQANWNQLERPSLHNATLTLKLQVSQDILGSGSVTHTGTPASKGQCWGLPTGEGHSPLSSTRTESGGTAVPGLQHMQTPRWRSGKRHSALWGNWQDGPAGSYFRRNFLWTWIPACSHTWKTLKPLRMGSLRLAATFYWDVCLAACTPLAKITYLLTLTSWKHFLRALWESVSWAIVIS